ncbi:peptidoglycan-binding protein LysM [Parahaliea aestuarii]|uniref:Potassium binding protein Kbp n=1 Tax=Parahaliea aestuarii TaxID=1852021 RepID=A0A5C8ZQB1_9GAMM|nr:peptidoglycan-binding protein LysM [Parahaliea aestuarii]TXS89994.1 peptidoglycan-binding protein LysM [Parahaliea aestuarii]
MGLFDFVSEAGEKLTEKVLGSTDNPDINKPVEISPERMNELRQQNISRMVAELDIDGEQVEVSVSGDKATLRGSAPSQEALEKIVLCAGNQHGIAQVDCQLSVDAPAAATASGAEPAASPAGESAFYTVQSGDTLGAIAKAHYGDAGKYMVIFKANEPILKDPDKIYPGQSLRIPAL